MEGCKQAFKEGSKKKSHRSWHLIQKQEEEEEEEEEEPPVGYVVSIDRTGTASPVGGGGGGACTFAYVS